MTPDPADPGIPGIQGIRGIPGMSSKNAYLAVKMHTKFTLAPPQDGPQSFGAHGSPWRVHWLPMGAHWGPMGTPKGALAHPNLVLFEEFGSP